MKQYRFIKKHGREFGIRWLFFKFSVYPNGYYNYLKNRKKAYYKSKSANISKIKKIYHKRNGTVGSKMIADLMALKGVKISRTTVYKYMKEMGLKAVIYRRKTGYVKGYQHKIFQNQLNQNFQASSPNSVWLTDFTYLYLADGRKRYNCTIIDMYNRSVVATKTSNKMTAAVAIGTLEAALKSRKNNITPIIHSDQGRQFSSREFTDFCQQNKVVRSMSKAGCPYDNSPMERFFSTFKNELIYQYSFKDDQTLYFAIKEYMFGWYNLERPHSFNNGIPPALVC